MARLHLVLSADEEAEFVASHLETIAEQFANDFDIQLRVPDRGPEWRMLPGVLQQLPYVVYARQMSEVVVELRRINILRPT